MKPLQLSHIVARFWAAALGVGLLAAPGCGAPSAGPKTQPGPQSQTPASTPEAAGCVAAAKQAASVAQQLHAESQLDAGYQMLDEQWRSCPQARRDLYPARLAALHDLGYVDATRELTALVLADALASAASRELALRLAALNAGPQATPAAELIRAAQLCADALRAEAAEETGNARVNWDRALHAYQRATSKPARAVALMAGLGPESLGEHGLLIPVRELPADRWRVAALDLKRDAARAVATPTRLLDAGTKATPSIILGVDGAFLLTSEDRTAYFPSPKADPVYFPAALAARSGRGGVVLLASEDALELRSITRPAEVEARLALVTTRRRVERMQSADSGRFVVLCQGIDGAEPVVAADTTARGFPIVVRDAVWCELDTRHAQLALLRTETTPTRARLWLELHPLDGRPAVRVLVPNARSIDDPVLSLTDDMQTAVVSVGRGKARLTLRFGLADGEPAPRAQLAGDALRGVPVGSADSVADLSGLTSLTRPPRRLIQPYYATLQTWSSNGVRSFDKRSVAVFDSDDDDGDIQLILADTTPLRVRQRIPLQVGVNWLTAFFVSDRVLAVQSYPALFFFDVNSGASLGTGDMSDGSSPRALDAELFTAGSELWDLASSREDKRVDLGLGQGVSWKQTGQSYTAELNEGQGRLELHQDGSSVLRGASAPPWLYCAFGDSLAHWRVCERRFEQRKH